MQKLIELVPNQLQPKGYVHIYVKSINFSDITKVY